MKNNKKAVAFCAFAALMFGVVNIPKVIVEASSLYTLPTDAKYVEDFLSLNVGETLKVSLSEGTYLVSSNTDIARVYADGRIRAVGFGRTKIDFVNGNITESVDIIVKGSNKTPIVTQANNFPSSYQGENNFYVYKNNNGDIENDLVSGISSFVLHDGLNAEGSYWDNITFVGRDHFGGRGSGALSYKVIYPGNYSFNYSAWILRSLRINSEYNTWAVDGFTTGLAKRDIDGKIEVLVSNIGTKESVVADATRYQMGTVTLDLLSGEEVMMFFASNGNGDCDEVYCDFEVIQNEIKGTPLYVLPIDLPIFESYPMLYSGDSIEVTLKEGATMTSSDTNIINVDGNRLVGNKIGNTTITITDGEETRSFEMFCDKEYSSNVISQRTKIPSKQGENNFNIYYCEDKNYLTALDNLSLVDDKYASAGQWSFESKIYVNNERVFVNGTGAIGFKVPSTGNYDIDYSSYLMSSIRSNPLYLTDWNVDGFTTGIAKKNKDGTIVVLKDNIGNKESVVDVKTMRQTAQLNLDLEKGEEILFFFNSNSTADADEIITSFNIVSNTTKIYDGSLAFSNSITKISDVGLLYLNETTKLVTSYDGELNYSSSNENVATVNENGLVTAKGVGTAVITAYDDFASKQLVVAVKSNNVSEILFSQNMLPSYQGENNAKLYFSSNGDIENDLVNGLKNVSEVPEKYYNASENSWWDSENRIVFINQKRVFTSGVGMLSYTVEKKGNYRLDYYAYLLEELSQNPNYGAWNVDGFTVGVGKKDKLGNITVVDAIINDKNGVVNNETRFMNNECICSAEAGDELFFFWASNGIGDCDEIVTHFTVQRIYLDDELKPVEIKLTADDVNLDIGQEIQINSELKNYVDQTKVWSSDNEEIAIVDQNGKVTAISSGYCNISLKIDDEIKIITIYVNYELSYQQGSEEDLSLTLNSEEDIYIYRIILNGSTVHNNNYSLNGNVLTLTKEYLDSLDIGNKTIECITEFGKVEIKLEILEKEIQKPNENPSDNPTDKPSDPEPTKNNMGLIIGITSGLIVITMGVFALIWFSKKKKKGA